MEAILDVALFSSTFFTLFVVMDPIGNLPIFLGLTSTMASAQRKRAAWQAVVVCLAVLIIFGAFGRFIFETLGISVAAIQTSGGLLLLLVALQLLSGKEEEPGSGGQGVNPAIVPLGTPLLAGPGSIVAVMLAVQKAEAIPGLVAVITGVLLTCLVQWVVFRFGAAISRLLGEGGITFLTRLSGMLLAAIAVQLVANGVLEFVTEYLESR